MVSDQFAGTCVHIGIFCDETYGSKVFVLHTTNVNSPLCLIKYQTRQRMGSLDTAPYMLSLGRRCMWVVSFTPRVALSLCQGSPLPNEYCSKVDEPPEKIWTFSKKTSRAPTYVRSTIASMSQRITYSLYLLSYIGSTFVLTGCFNLSLTGFSNIWRA